MTREEAVRRIEQVAQEKLRELDLGGLELEELPPEIAKCLQLETLRLGAGYMNPWVTNKLTNFPDAVLGLTNLKKLDLSRNQITQLPEGIGQLSNLRELWLNDNQITQIPEWLGQLSNLTLLNLYRNQISVIPEALGQLSNLTKLSFGENEITSIPEALGQLSQAERDRIKFDLGKAD